MHDFTLGGGGHFSKSVFSVMKGVGLTITLKHGSVRVAGGGGSEKRSVMRTSPPPQPSNPCKSISVFHINSVQRLERQYRDC